MRDAPPAPSRGSTLLEAVVASALGSGLLLLALGTLATHQRVVRGLVAAAETLDAVRAARHVLSEELRWSGAGAASPDTLGLRAFRGVAVVCGSDGGGAVRVRAEGLRRPDPSKDSVLWWSPGAGWTAATLQGDEPAGTCAGGPARRWSSVPPPPTGAALARWFERGSYHLVDGALRYRRGRSGRQPLTGLRLRTPGSVFRALPGGGAGAELRGLGGDTLPWPVGAGGAP